VGHKYFSAEKFRDPVSARLPPTLKSFTESLFNIIPLCEPSIYQLLPFASSIRAHR
jgi:hypothetical protein